MRKSVAAAFSHTYLLSQLLGKGTKALELLSDTASKQAVTCTGHCQKLSVLPCNEEQGMRNISSFGFQKCCYWAAFTRGQKASALIVPRTEIQAQIQTWYKQAQFHSKLNGVSRSNSRTTHFCYKYLCTIINPSGRTLGMHYQLFIYSLPQESWGFYSLGSDVASYSKVMPVRNFLTKRGFVG